MDDDTYLFGKLASFDQTFPELENAHIEVTEHGKGAGGGNTRTYDKTSTGEFIRCSNENCYRGGASIGYIIFDMIQKKQTEHEASAMCQGQEGRGRIHRSCRNTYRIKVKLTYKPS